MRTRTSAAKAAHLYRGLRARLTAAVIAASNKTLVEATYELQQASAGTLSPKDLRAKDHPYAKRHGRALVDPATLNEDTGELRRSWKRGRILRVAGGVAGRVVNTSEHGRFIKEGGSPPSKMVKRPLVQRVIRRVRPEHLRRVKAAITNTLKGA